MAGKRIYLAAYGIQILLEMLKAGLVEEFYATSKTYSSLPAPPKIRQEHTGKFFLPGKQRLG
jgi:hypothetical protein